MTTAEQLRPKHASDSRFRVLEAIVRQWEFNRFLYALVGDTWGWRDRLLWSDEQWRSYVESESTFTFVGYHDGAPAGYFELHREGDDVEIACFGLAPRFIGKGLGGPLLTHALVEAWRLDPRRVWVHTCSLDHPAALRNYMARGMAVFRVETTESNARPERAGGPEGG